MLKIFCLGVILLFLVTTIIVPTVAATDSETTPWSVIPIQNLTVAYPPDWTLVYDETFTEIQIRSPNGCLVGVNGMENTEIDSFFMIYVQNLINNYPDFTVLRQDNTTFNGLKANRFEIQWTADDVPMKKLGYFIQQGDDFVELYFDGPADAYDLDLPVGEAIINTTLFT
jgi:hypothetical protein